MFIRGGSAPRSNPLPFYILFFSKEVPLDVYAIFKILRCWLSSIFRVGQYLRRQERRKWTSKTFFFFLQDRCSKDQFNCRNGWAFILWKSQKPLSNIPRRSIGALIMDQLGGESEQKNVYKMKQNQSSRRITVNNSVSMYFISLI